MFRKNAVAPEVQHVGRLARTAPVSLLPDEEFRPGICQHNMCAFLALMAVAVIYAIAVWGYGALFWGDQGRWLHEIDRFALGQVVYRDFNWAFPPLSMWLLGGYARIFGSDLASVWTATSAIFIGIAALYYLYVAHLVERSLVLPTALAGLVLAIVYANTSGVSLPQGMYTPAAPVGVLFLLTGVLLAVRMIQRPGTRLGILLGIACGACILTKQDVWPPAVYLIAVSIGVTLSSGLSGDRRVAAAATLAAFVTTIAAGAVLIVVQSGAPTLVGVLGGFGHAAEFGGSGLPSWERLTVETLACALIGVVLVVLLRVGGGISRRQARAFLVLTSTVALACLALHVGMGYYLASHVGTEPLPFMSRFVATIVEAHIPLFRPLLGLLRDRLLQHLLPAMLPGLVLVGLLVARRHLSIRPLFRPVLLLLGLCLAARIRRMFGGVEWYHFLLEIPVYMVVLRLVLAEGWERVRPAVVVLLVLSAVSVGGYSHWKFGRGPLTRRANWEQVLTPRGVYYMPSNQAAEYRQIMKVLLQIDPTGRRSLFAFGDTGGFNYFTGRNNPTPLTQGFRLSNVEPEQVVASLARQTPAPILLDNTLAMATSDPATSPDWTRWETPAVRGVHARFDRKLFDRALQGCAPAGGVGGRRPYFTIYDCRR